PAARRCGGPTNESPGVAPSHVETLLSAAALAVGPVALDGRSPIGRPAVPPSLGAAPGQRGRPRHPPPATPPPRHPRPPLDLATRDLHPGGFDNLAGLSAWTLLFVGAWVICGTLGISLYLRTQIHRLPAHKSMLNVAETIYTTCKTYLLQQGKFLLMLFVLI